MRSFACGLAALTVLPCLGAVSMAGVVVSLDGTYGPIGAHGGASADTPDPNNDNVTGESPNTFVSEEIEITALDPIDLVLGVTNSGGITEYFLDIGTVRNSTGVDWYGFRATGGSGYGDDFVPGRDMPPGVFASNPRWDYDITPSTDVFDLTRTEEDTVEFYGGGVLHHGETGLGLNFAGDIPDIIIPGVSGYQLTIRLEPLGTVPEPTTLTLLSVAALAIGWQVHRRKR